jgi:hypothetical protein
MAIFKSKPSKFLSFWPSSYKSPTHTGLICVKTRSRISQAWAPLMVSFSRTLLMQQESFPSSFKCMTKLEEEDLMNFPEFVNINKCILNRICCLLTIYAIYNLGENGMEREGEVVD